MNDNPHRNYQNLPKIGPVFSTIDEKQRAISEEILNLKIRPELKLKINMNIPGLERKKFISPYNPTTRRLFQRLSCFGKEGWLYVWTIPNTNRFFIPFLCTAFLYYYAESFFHQIWWDKEHNNGEHEAVYAKMQNISCYYIDKNSLMA